MHITNQKLSFDIFTIQISSWNMIYNEFWHKIKMYNFDSYNVLLSIATNIAVLRMTAFVLQGHICSDTFYSEFLSYFSSFSKLSRINCDNVRTEYIYVWLYVCNWLVLYRIINWSSGIIKDWRVSAGTAASRPSNTVQGTRFGASCGQWTCRTSSPSTGKCFQTPNTHLQYTQKLWVSTNFGSDMD